MKRTWLFIPQNLAWDTNLIGKNFLLLLSVPAVLSLAFLQACTEEPKQAELVPDFEIIVTGEAPAAQVSLVNKSTGAESYQWTFDEGADLDASSENEPVVSVDKAGDFIITLQATAGEETKEVIKKVSIGGNSPVKTFSNIYFSLTNSGRFFSTETGKLYKANEVDKLNGRNIDLAFSGIDGFESPRNEDEVNIPGATITKVKNHVTTELSVDEFHAMVTDQKLKSMIVEDDDTPFQLEAPQLILFENSFGKKGVILVKALYDENILTDIKVQKY